ncbi:hypothetical protein FRC04_005820 [Tulasnella sp. 424]|nr:hypothetical protein FRC04_005820 [Tulasnella sp. 424]KAG8962732.1 hypothetical protein FRC05_005134 [Tulasnella sp. 425]
MPGRAAGSVSLQNFHDDIRKDLYSHRQYYDALVYSKYRPTAAPLRMRVTIPCSDFFPRQEMNSACLRGSLLPPRLCEPEYDIFLDAGAEWHAEVCTPTSPSYLDTIEFTYEGRVVRILDAQSEEEDHWIMVVDLAWREGDCLAWRVMQVYPIPSVLKFLLIIDSDRCNITPEFGCGLRRVLRSYLDNGTCPAIAFTGDYHSMMDGTDGISKFPVYQPWSISLLEGLQRSGYPRIFTPNNPEPPIPTFIPRDTILQKQPAFRDASTQTTDHAPNAANSFLPGSPSVASSVSSPNEGTPGMPSLKGGDLVAPFVRAIWAGLGTFFLRLHLDIVEGGRRDSSKVMDDDVEERHESQSGFSDGDEGSTDDLFSTSSYGGTVDGGHPSGRDDPRRSEKLKRKRSEDANEAGEMVKRRRAV